VGDFWIGWNSSDALMWVDFGDGNIMSHTTGITHTYSNDSEKTVQLWPDSLDWVDFHSLWINGRNYTGTLPSFSICPSLIFLDASYNQLTGTIPSFAACPDLYELRLNSNSFSGVLPDFSSNTSLITFIINDNPSVYGTLSSFAGMTALEYFNIINTGLTGALPSFSGCTGLKYFFANQVYGLTGSLPSFADSTGLIEFRCDDNTGLTGSLPSFNTCTSLQFLHINVPEFTGTIPTFHNCTNLIEVYIPMNVGTGFTGYTSGAFNNQVNLNSLNFYGSSLSQANVDAILADLVTSLGLGGRVTCYVSLDGGSNAHPSGAGITSHNTLEAAGWTVDIN
jgi:hypothetical protein